MAGALECLTATSRDVFTLARIAGHSSITITQRYVHPQADAIERAFAPFGSTNVNSLGTGEDSQVGTTMTHNDA
jgi:hypothetical protein